MAVGFYNFADLHNEEFKAKIKDRISQIIDKNAYVEGEYNTKFEEEFAKMQGAKHCLLVANGTDALQIALHAYDVCHGDKVGVPGITFFATAEAVVTRGAEPILIDVDPTTGLMCPKSLERTLKVHKLKAIMPVHIYGQPAPIEELWNICQKHDIKIIEDGAQAQGTHLKNGPIGSFPNSLVTLSFYPTKNLSAFGDAGGILTNDSALAEKIKSLRNHGRSPSGHIVCGYNSRCDHIQAAVLHLKLEKVEQYNKQRKEIAKKYHQLFKGVDIRIVPEEFLATSSWHLYPVGLKSREEKYALGAYLKERGIGNALFYEKAIPEEKPMANAKGEKETALRFAAETICLPMNPFMKENELQEVVTTVKAFLASYRK